MPGSVPIAEPGFDDGESLGARFRQHGGESTHVYGYAMRGMADDWDTGGVVREICRDWADAPPGSVVQLRLLAAVFRVVLRGDAPQLAAYYPVLGGDLPAEGVWSVMREVMAAHADELREALAVAPQTNEVGRSLALLAGLFEAVRRSGLSAIRLLELGASGGLNLNVDRFRFEGDGWAAGPAASPLVLGDGIRGAVNPERFVVLERRGCDVEPVDVSTAAGRLRLTSFIWPFHLERHQRLRAALAVAEQHPVTVDRASAGQWLRARLAPAPPPGVLTVVWQSITRMYWPAEEVARVGATIARARERMPLAHVAMEYAVNGRDAFAELRVDDDLFATVGHHGGPVEMVAQTGADGAR